MKRYVKSSTQYPHYMSYNYGRHKFAIHYTDPNGAGDMKAQISSVHPYDDADYTWAKITGPQVIFYRDGKEIDRMTLPAYDPEDYESLDEYIDETIDSICAELINFDKDIQLRMMYD